MAENKLMRALAALDSMTKLKREEPKPLDGKPPFTVPDGGKVEVWRSLHGGMQARISFPNGYEASVVRHSGSYGSEEGLWELAVCDAKSGGLLYDTPITDDVIGHQSEAEIDALLVRIAELPKR